MRFWPKSQVGGKIGEQRNSQYVFSGWGNSTGLGMAPFIVNHPTLLNNWILTRETALKKIREIQKVKPRDSLLFKDSLKKSLVNITSWNTESSYQQKKN